MGNRTHGTGRRQGLIAAALLWLAASGTAWAESACRADTVMLRGDWGTVRFNVEIADEPMEQARGLMGREAMPVSSGMLFVYPAPRSASFWMRNTLIPLDMLFVDDSGVVTHIHHRAVPLDETPIHGGDDVLAVLEINGGLAERLGIDEGTQLRHPAFAPHAPAWPC
ncbi:hypothetical protein BOO69_10360 [Sulfitobacter alexandrii]|uniref:DUF192 domain-containing protein n=1 Tax=Sulfitobacter alexandrii TaxID=1917485 RepID=A0A1J0WHI7_9RHOB|nr:DUF192 domain-containing protein [Sulfitobacter alexandrii]APE43770.1 hypothetical protein BOO69_10360 [Sulfitobacter alexandrii]